MTNKATIRIEGSDKVAEFPLVQGSCGVEAIDMEGLYHRLGVLSYDPSLASTANCKSAITHLDGERCMLWYRGYPIEQLAKHCSFLEVAYLLMYGELPTDDEFAGFNERLHKHSMLHESLRKFFDGFYYNAHPMAMMVGVMGSRSAFDYGELDMENPDHRILSAVRMVAKVPAMAAACYRHSEGWPYVYPRVDLGYCENFLNMMFAMPSQKFIGKNQYIDPVSTKALNALFIVHADHGLNASAATVRLVSSTGASPYACIAAGVAALWGYSHGRANEAVLRMLAEIGDAARIPEFIAKAKDDNDAFELMGFGHRAYKKFDPRAVIIRELCFEVLEKCQDKNNAKLIELALALEERVLQDDYFVERNLHPNVDFYSGIIYKALKIPENMMTVMLVIARTAGWVAHWLEMMAEPERHISRPRQIYTGHLQRDVMPKHQRATKSF